MGWVAQHNNNGPESSQSIGSNSNGELFPKTLLFHRTMDKLQVCLHVCACVCKFASVV